jgi:hypothetical protein
VSRRQPGQSVLEYALILSVLLGALGLGWAALSGGENAYFGFVGRNVAPTPPAFDALPYATPAPTSPPGATSTPTSAPTATPTPTPDPSLNRTRTTVDCGPTSATVPAASAYTTTCTVTVENLDNGSRPSGTVSWLEDSTGSFAPPACTLDSHTATCQVTYSSSVAGTHTINAYYQGTSGNGNGSGNGFQSSGGSTTLSLTRSTNTAVVCSFQGQPGALVVGAGSVCRVTVSDTSNAPAVVPTGTIAWTATPSAAGGTGSLQPSTCTLTRQSLSSAACQIVFTPTNITSPTGFSFAVGATFAGDSTHQASNGVANVAVSPAQTSTQTFDISALYGETGVTLTAVISVNLPSTLPSTTIGQGTVTFEVTGSGRTICTSDPIAVSSGSASARAGQAGGCVLPADLEPGSYTITARYSGGNNFAASEGTALLGIGLINTVTTAAPMTVPYGVASVSLTATLRVSYPATGQVNQGTVTFRVSSGGTTICTTSPVSVAPNADGTTAFASAVCNIPNGTRVGQYTITPSFSGGSNFNPSSDPSSAVNTGLLTISTRATGVSVVCAPSDVNAGAPTTCTARVTDTDVGTASTPTGSVLWQGNGGGSFDSASCDLNASGTCQATYTPVNGGSETISGYYQGDPTHQTGAGSAPLTVHRTSRTSVVCDPNPLTVDNTTTCTATVADTSPVGVQGTPSGTVSWTATPDAFGTFGSGASCVLRGGTCSISFTPVAIGSITMAASYPGDATYVTSAGSTVLQVARRATTTTVDCTPNPDSVGVATSCTATVTDVGSGPAATPTGSVSWTSGANGTFSPTTCTLSGASGSTATCQVSYTPGVDGPHVVTAAYGGDATTHDVSSGSANLAAVLGTATSVVCTPNPDGIDAPTTCRATVTGGTNAPTGSLTWSSNSGVTAQFSSASCTLDGSGACSVTYTPSTFGASNINTITASYGGDSRHLTSSGHVDLTVSTRSTAVSVVCAPNPVGRSSVTTCTATISDTDGGTPTTPGGTVTWTASPAGGSLSATSCALSGSACSVTYTTSSTPGSYTIGAAYAGDALHTASTSAPYSVAVVRVATTVATCTPSVVVVGTAVTCTATVTDSGSGQKVIPTGTITWSVVPATGGSFSPQATCTLNAGGGNSSSCSVTYIASAAGARTLTATYSGDAVHAPNSATASLTSNAGLAILAAPTTSPAGGTVSLTVNAVDQSGARVSNYTGTIAFTSTDGQATLPATYTFTPGDGGTHTFGSTIFTTAGTQTVTVRDTSTGTTAFTSIVVTGGPATRLAITTSPTTTVAGTPLGVTVTALDQYNNPAAGYLGTATFSSTDGQAELPATYTFTVGDAGTHSFASAATLKTAGTQSISVTDNSVSGSSASVVVSPAAAAQVVLGQQPTNVTAAAAMSPAVTVGVRDTYGNTVTGSSASIGIAIATNPSGGTLGGTTTVSAVGGVATFTNLSIDRAGTGYTLVASSPGLASATSSAFNVTAGQAARLAFTSQPTSTVAGAAISPAVQVSVQDAAGNTVTSNSATITVALQANPSGATLGGTLTLPATNGVATFPTLTISPAGSAYSLAASAAGLASATSATFNVTAGPASTLVLSAPSSATAGSAFSVTLTAQDAYGNTATGYTGTVHFTSTDGQAALPGNYTFTATDAGTHAVSVTLGSAGAQTITATDIATGTLTATTASINVGAGSARSLSVAGYLLRPIAGTVNTFVVTVHDAYGNPATGYTGTLSFASSDGRATLPANYHFTATDNGVHVFSATLVTAGPQTISATDTVTSSITGSQDGITVAPRSADHLSVVASTGTTTAGNTFDVTVTAQDQYANVATGYIGSVHFTSSDGQASVPGTYAFVAGDGGTQTFSGLILRTAGTATVTGTDLTTGTITGSTNSITVGAAAPATLGFVQQPTNAAAGSAIAPAVSVQVTDAYSNLVSGVSVSIAIGSNPGAGSLSGTTTQNTVNGMGPFANLSINRSGAGYTLVASTAGVTSATSTSFSITPGAVSAALSTVSASPSSVAVNTGTATITVTLRDALGNAVSGKTVTLSQPNGRKSVITTVNGTTNAAGQATFTVSDTKAESVTYTAQDASDGVTITQQASVTFA